MRNEDLLRAWSFLKTRRTLRLTLSESKGLTMPKAEDLKSILTEFAAARQVPTLALLLPSESLAPKWALKVRRALAGKSFECIDLLIHSGGVDQLATVDHRVTSHKDSFNTGEANTSMSVRRPFSAVGMVVGARIHL